MESVRRWPLTEVLVSPTHFHLNITIVCYCQYVGESPQDYLTAIANREIAWIRGFAVPKPPKDIFVASEAQNSPNSHVSLYEMFLRTIPYLFPKTNSSPSPPFGIGIFIPQISLWKAIELRTSLTGRIHGLGPCSFNSGTRNSWILMARCC
jgi:hypothetical protein